MFGCITFAWFLHEHTWMFGDFNIVALSLITIFFIGLWFLPVFVLLIIKFYDETEKKAKKVEEDPTTSWPHESKRSDSYLL